MKSVVRTVHSRLAVLGVSRYVTLLGLGQGLAATGASMVIPLLAPVITQLQTPLLPSSILGVAVSTELQVGVFFSILGVVRSVCQVPFGRISDRVGVRNTFLEMGFAVSGATIVGFGLVGSFSALLSLRILQGIALAAATPALMALVEEFSVDGSRGGSMGTVSMLRTLGWGVGPVLGGAVADTFGLQVTFAFGALLVGISVLGLRLTIPRSDSPGNPDAQSGGSKSLLRVQFSTRRQARVLIGISVAVFALMMGISAIVSLEGAIIDRIGGSIAGFGIVFAIPTVTRLVVQLPTGHLSDRYRPEPFIIGGLLASVPLVAATGLADSLVLFTILRGLQGLSVAAVLTPGYALAADVADRHHSGEQLALVTTASSVGFATGPLVSGGLASMKFHVPFFVVATIALCCTVLSWILLRANAPGSGVSRDSGN